MTWAFRIYPDDIGTYILEAMCVDDDVKVQGSITVRVPFNGLLSLHGRLEEVLKRAKPTAVDYR